MSRETEKDTAKETNCSIKEARAAEHDARNHGTEAGVFERGNDEKNSEPFDNSPGGWASGFADALSGFFK